MTAIRIDADHIAFTDDGHAWWVCNPAHVPVHLANLDDVCGTCGGTNLYHNGMGADACPDCIDGRHTFEIETDCIQCGRGGMVQIGNYPDQSARTIRDCAYWTEGHRTLTHRVSIVPGMVLPIVRNWNDWLTLPLVSIEQNGDTVLVENRVDGFVEKVTDIVLPPAAAPGMWAVKLKVA